MGRHPAHPDWCHNNWLWQHRGGASMTESWAIITTIIAVLFGSYGSVLFKKGSEKFSLSIDGIFKNPYLIKGALLFFSSSLVFIVALRGGELSVLYPLVSISYIMVAFYSMRELKEKMNAKKWIGIVLIIIGVSLIGVGS